ncbi:uncharacterized protein BP01DRAFT_392875 [Aspergillus saccharolyticus JOP 1030-1]|uniref:Zn(2)-C6 fungal-type domain-containing protein n=1 Tax=Aspergillus saccharolyticus JOP 1030-1 TaxID=1450539 RepID=A0A318Z9M8_9EURO|nr:hypothetical protein BP01DRAFT_392875 [Aspergillus saccharolyticus JOP 1030-1]PYH44056.1 hypothetical protein BP01DRAFT_392875 [Aspergillus saccharolyticus JOP 1030-1]
MSSEARIRKRIPKSCKRCHRRKQRCVGYPTCAGCESANQPCLRSETVPSWHHAMSKGALVHRIEMLESQLATAVARIGPEQQQQQQQQKNQDRSSSPHDLDQTAVLSLLSLDRGYCHGPAYLGPSSGRTIAESLGRMAQDTVWTESLPIHAGSDPSDTIASGPSELTGDDASPPGRDVGMRLIDAYFRDLHNRLPFLDRCEVYDLHETIHRNTQSGPRGSTSFKIFMVYAIGASILQMTDSYDSTPPRDFWTMATGSPSALGFSSPYARIEAILLLVLYDLRTAAHSSVWYTIGLAMRICVDLGLHRESQYRAMRPHDAHLRRRLFWSVYLVERYVSWSLGRPFSIAEKDIDANVPAAMDDAIHENSSNPAKAAPGLNLRRFVATIQLQRIMSRIHSEIYRVDRNVSDLISEVPPLMTDLEDFERSQPVMALDDSTFVRMHWYNCVRMLLQRFLCTLSGENLLVQKCLVASGQMCQCFKTLRQRDSSGYSFLLANSLFMAGLTMCLCLFRAPQLWSFAVSEDLRACSLSMFMMAERNPSLRKYRDGFETIMARAVAFVNNATGGLSGEVEGSTADDPPTSWGGSAGQMSGGSHICSQWLDVPIPPPAIDSLHNDASSLQCHGLQEMLDNLQSFGDLMQDDFWTDIPWAPLAE